MRFQFTYVRINGMINVRPRIFQGIGIIRTTRCRPIRIESKHEASEILHPAPRQQGSRSERPALQLIRLVQPLMLPPMESDIPDNP
ncbi:hypothetical protein AYI69_g7553 [Smittium culicis]|uniref:Uncharacterized protein n=1 Tax=Smittium culicis TaxID=133412 RepID=A0A1R1XR71_9FUNG|nr:hypothetical protein AYI69_g7553 [Smittium culicis]